MKRSLWGCAPALAALCLWGCSNRTDRTINLAGRQITTQNPIGLSRDGGPVAFSSDGSRVASFVFENPTTGAIRVVDSDSMAPIGELRFRTRGVQPNRLQQLTMVSKEGSDVQTLDMRDDALTGSMFVEGNTFSISNDAGDLLCDWGSDKLTWSPHATASTNAVQYLESSFNFDRTLGICYAGTLGQRPAPGAVMRNGRTVCRLTGKHAGFDQFGNAWFGSGNSWTCVNREGLITHAKKRPGYLVHDQTKDRGSLHLVETETEMKHLGSKANIGCIWLWSDRAVPLSKVEKGKRVILKDPYKAAVVFAGPDVDDFGFVPGKDIVYVDSSFGSYLVPFSTEKQKQA